MSNSIEQRQIADQKLRVQRLEEQIKIYASTFARWCMSEEGWEGEEFRYSQLQYRHICDELVRLLRNQQPETSTCEWRYNGQHQWSGSCGATWVWLSPKTPATNWHFCPMCGRPMVDIATEYGELEWTPTSS